MAVAAFTLALALLPAAQRRDGPPDDPHGDHQRDERFEVDPFHRGLARILP